MSIECHSLTKSYRRGLDAVHDLTFSVQPGSVFALMGRNGAGKSTTIQLLLDLLLPQSGEAKIFGVPVQKLTSSHRQRIGYVSESQALPDWMRVEQYLRFLKPMYPTWDDDFTTKLVKIFALPMQQKLNTLSRGQRMKVAFLGALCYLPEVLILDEPFSGLDSLIRQDLLDSLVEFLASGTRTVLLCSHDLEEIGRLADTLGILDNGKLVLQGKVDELLSTAREVTFSTRLAAPVHPLPSQWWNVQTGPLGATFLASAVVDESALKATIYATWPDAQQLSIQPASLHRFYVDFLRSQST